MNKIEKYLNNSGKREKYLIYFMIFGLIFYFFMILIIPMYENRNVLVGEIDELKMKLSNNSLSRLRSIKTKRKKELLVLKSNLDKQASNNRFLISKLYKLKYAFYDDEEWAKSIDNILKESISRNIKITYIKSKDAKNIKNTNILKKKRSIEISGVGNYIDIVAFISYIDNLNTLLKFNKVQMKLNNKVLEFKFQIGMYGIGL